MGKTISVIVPIYQVEKYLEKCIQSILQQTYKELEIILVDDGSKDGCPAMCDQFKNQDARIKVIHKKNGGLSSARNAGIEIATGDYITFVDSDDYVDVKMLEMLMDYTQTYQSDIAVCFWEEVWEDGKEIDSEDWQGPQNAYVECMNQVKAMEKMLYQRDCDSCAWGKLFKRDLWKTIRFPEQKIYEDIAVMYQVFGLAKRVVFSDYQGYFYMQRSASISKANFAEKKMSLIDFTEQNETYMKLHYPQLVTAAKSRSVRANFHIYLQIPPKDVSYKENRKRIEKNIKERRKIVLCDKETGMGTKAALLMTYLGFGFFLACRKFKNWGKTM